MPPNPPSTIGHRLHHQPTCTACGGTGHISADLTGLPPTRILAIGLHITQCPHCNGTGQPPQNTLHP